MEPLLSSYKDKQDVLYG